MLLLRITKGTLREIWNEFLNKNSNKWDAEKLQEMEEKEKWRKEIEKEDGMKESFYNLGDELVVSEEYKGTELKVIVKVHVSSLNVNCALTLSVFFFRQPTIR